MGKGETRRELKGWSLLALSLLGGCLNPRPEELPSALEPAPNGASGEPTAALAPEDSSGARAAEPVGDPASDGADRPESTPAPEPPAVLDVPEPPDAGADSGPSSEPADAGGAGDGSDAG